MCRRAPPRHAPAAPDEADGLAESRPFCWSRARPTAEPSSWDAMMVVGSTSRQVSTIVENARDAASSPLPPRTRVFRLETSLRGAHRESPPSSVRNRPQGHAKNPRGGARKGPSRRDQVLSRHRSSPRRPGIVASWPLAAGPVTGSGLGMTGHPTRPLRARQERERGALAPFRPSNVRPVHRLTRKPVSGGSCRACR